MNMQHGLIQKHILYKFKLGHNTMETTKNIRCVKGEEADNHSTITRQLKKIVQIARTSMIRQSQVSLKIWIPKPCSKPLMQIRQVALREYQAGLSFHSLVWFVTFTPSAKSSRTAELFLRLPKYSKTFNSPSYKKLFIETGFDNEMFLFYLDNSWISQRLSKSH